MAPTILGLDIGGTNLRSGFVDEQYALTGFRISSSQLICGDNAPEKIAAYIRGTIAEAGILPVAIAIGFPSTLDRNRRKLLSTPNLEGLNNLNMAERLEDALSMPVYIDRDVNPPFSVRLPCEPSERGCDDRLLCGHPDLAM